MHPNIIRLLTGCQVINHKFSLDLELGDMLFLYILKKTKKNSAIFLSFENNLLCCSWCPRL